MKIETIIINGIAIIKKYFPNLFGYISESDFEKFVKKSYEHSESNVGGTANNNFIVTFLELVKEHELNNSSIIRNEFVYFNYLFGEFLKFGNSKKFKDLINSTLINFKSNDFKHTLGEIGACLQLRQFFSFVKYEQTLGKGITVDFEFKDNNGNVIYIDVFSIEYDESRYEKDKKDKFEKFIDKRIKDKFDAKSVNLSDAQKSQLYIYPIIFDITIEIVKENELYLKNLCFSKLNDKGFQRFEPKFFGNIQGTFFNLFSVDEIVNPEKYYKLWNVKKVIKTIRI